MGMSKDRFDQVLNILGVTDNFDGTEPGQFGIGFASYATISDTVTLETYSRETREKFTLVGKNNLEFYERDTLDMDSYGTRISMDMKDDCDGFDMCSMAKKCSKLCEVPTVITHTDKHGKVTTFECDGKHTVENMAKFSIRKDKSTKLRFKGRFIHIFDDIMDLAFTYNDTNSNHTDAYLARMPINYQYVGRYQKLYGCMFVNIKNERDFVPLCDRKSFPEPTEDKITEHIDEIIGKKLKLLSAPTIRKHLENDETAVLDMAVLCDIQVDGHNEEFSKIFDYKGTFNHSAHNDLRCVLSSCNLDRILVTEDMEDRYVDALTELDPSTVVFCPHSKSHFDILVGAGFRTPEQQYLKDNS